MELIKRVLAHWNITDFSVAERYHEETERILCRIETPQKAYFLRGVPQEKGEETVRGNVLAHSYLGNRHHIAPMIFPTCEGDNYISEGGHLFYLTEYIDGKNLEETEADEYDLGKLTARLHGLKGHTHPTGLNCDKSRFYEWFMEKPFKANLTEF